MDGLDAGSALLEAQPSFPIFLMSGYSKDGVAASRHMSRFSGYLAKPFGLSVIRTALQQLQNQVNPNLVQGSRLRGGPSSQTAPARVPQSTCLSRVWVGRGGDDLGRCLVGELLEVGHEH
jgi:DNA-binding NarL/FixJ family response regulator